MALSEEQDRWFLLPSRVQTKVCDARDHKNVQSFPVDRNYVLKVMISAALYRLVSSE